MTEIEHEAEKPSTQVAEYCEDSVSEAVIRKALYWASESIDWQLESIPGHWSVSWIGVAADKAQLDRLVNDFLLREKLDRETGTMRRNAIDAALRRLVNHE